MLVVSKQARDDGIHNGTKYAGLIMFDLCGAGALGAVIAQSSFPEDIFQLSLALPIVLIPFVLALFLQAATGSRVVSAATTAHILAAATTTMSTLSGFFHPAALILMIAGGSCMVSFVSDPYFWLIKRFTKDDTLGVIKGYTLPLMAIGALIGMIGIIIQIILTNT
jgi:GntP family gluconate:H+ symporter